MSLKFDDKAYPDATWYWFDPIRTESEQILSYIDNIFINTLDHDKKKDIIILGEKGMAERLSVVLEDRVEFPSSVCGIELEYNQYRGFFRGHHYCLIGTSKLNNSPGGVYVFFQ